MSWIMGSEQIYDGHYILEGCGTAEYPIQESGFAAYSYVKLDCLVELYSYLFIYPYVTSTLVSYLY